MADAREEPGQKPSAEDVLWRLESWRRAGVTHLPRVELPETVEEATDSGTVRGREVSQRTEEQSMPRTKAAKGEGMLFGTIASEAESLPRAERVNRLQVLSEEVAKCERCPVLVEERTQTVFGVGNPEARLCFLGEAPGANEDAEGEPFVGRAGQLLTKIIEACTLKREEVYILNVLKCRPPGNRNPEADEVTNCRGYLDRQLEIIRPEYICCLGSVAAKTLLEVDTPIGRMRQKFHDYRGIPVWCTYHPAYLLRNPAAKKDVWEDMKLLMQEMDIHL